MMNREEEIAYRFLCDKYGGEIQFEPDGKIPPDFRLGSDCAVEVRRLNQHFWNGGRPEGIESLAVPLWSAFQEVLSSFDQHNSGASYWVFIDFRRPLPSSMKVTKQEIRSALQGYLDNYAGANRTIEVNNHVELSILAATPVNGHVFMAGGSSDDDFGGWLVQVYVENLRHCIAEKAAKIGKLRSRYPVWWLLLVDHIGWGLDAAETQEVINGIGGLGGFDRVVVLDRSAEHVLADMAGSIA